METTLEPETKIFRALVADDFPGMQQALVACLKRVPNVEVVGTAANGRDALENARNSKPDLVVADLQMPIMDGFQLLRELRRTYPDIALVAVSGHYSPAIEQEALAAGADAFVSKSGLPHDLLNVLGKLTR